MKGRITEFSHKRVFHGYNGAGWGGFYEVDSENEDHTIFLQTGLILLNKKYNSNLLLSPMVMASLCEKIVFYEVFNLKMRGTCTRSVTVGKLWSPNQ